MPTFGSKQYKTAKGRPIDWERIRRQNESEVAIGNAHMNARGDILGQGGQVIKTREQIREEYNTDNPDAVRHVSIKQEQKQRKPATDAPGEVPSGEVQEASGSSRSPKRRRKSSDYVTPPTEEKPETYETPQEAFARLQKEKEERDAKKKAPSETKTETAKSPQEAASELEEDTTDSTQKSSDSSSSSSSSSSSKKGSSRKIVESDE